MKQLSRIYRGHIPFVRFLLALLAGIAVGYAITPQQPLYIAAWMMLVILAASFVCFMCFTKLRQYGHYATMGCLALSALAVIGFIQSWHSDPEIDRSHFSRYESKALVGYIADEPLMRGEHLRFPLAVTRVYGEDGLVDVSGKLMLTIRIQDTLSVPMLRYGDELVIPAVYREVPPPYNPGELNYQRYLANKDIWHQAYLQADETKKIGTDKGNPLVAQALAVRQRMVGKFSRHIAHEDALSVASTLILGYRADLSETLLQAFSNTGTIHVLSVSGMHVVIVFWLFSKLFWWMNRNKGLRIAKFMLLLTAIWGYALLTGFSPSVLRAAMMTSFVMAAMALGQRNRVYNSIAASAFFLLLYHPKFIADVGFQLSYLAVLGIVSLYPVLQAAFPVANRFARPVLSYTWLSIAAQTGAGPLATYYFHQFPLYFLPANLLVVLPASGIMYLGFALLLLPAGPLAAWTGAVLETLILMVNRLLSDIESLPMASIRGIWMTWWQSLLIYFSLLTAVLAFVMRSKRLVYGMLACCLLLAFSAFSAIIQGSHGREVTIFNVGRDIVIGLVSKGEAWIYSDRPAMDDRTIRYSALPKLEAHVPMPAIGFVPQDSSYRGQQLYIKESIIQFGNLRLMVYDGSERYTGHVHVDILLLRNNPRIAWEKLTEIVSCKRLLLDGSNSDSTIRRLKGAAEKVGIPVYVLKNNFAYTQRDGEG